jgi:hypothetical protein
VLKSIPSAGKPSISVTDEFFAFNMGEPYLRALRHSPRQQYQAPRGSRGDRPPAVPERSTVLGLIGQYVEAREIAFTIARNRSRFPRRADGAFATAKNFCGQSLQAHVPAGPAPLHSASIVLSALLASARALGRVVRLAPPAPSTKQAAPITAVVTFFISLPPKNARKDRGACCPVRNHTIYCCGMSRL